MFMYYCMNVFFVQTQAHTIFLYKPRHTLMLIERDSTICHGIQQSQANLPLVLLCHYRSHRELQVSDSHIYDSQRHYRTCFTTVFTTVGVPRLPTNGVLYIDLVNSQGKITQRTLYIEIFVQQYKNSCPARKIPPYTIGMSLIPFELQHEYRIHEDLPKPTQAYS